MVNTILKMTQSSHRSEHRPPGESPVDSSGPLPSLLPSAHYHMIAASQNMWVRHKLLAHAGICTNFGVLLFKGKHMNAA